MIKKKLLIVLLMLFLFFNYIYSSFAKERPEDEFDKNIRILLDKRTDISSINYALESLELLGDQRAVPYLIKALGREEFPSPFSAIHALSTLGGKDATNFLLKYRSILGKKLESVPSDTDRIYYTGQEIFTVAALYKLGHKEYINFVYKAAESEDKGIRYDAAHALGMVKNKRSRDILFQILKNDDELPACGAAAGLLEHRDKDIVSTLCTMIKKGEVLYCLEDIGKIAKEIGMKKGGPCDNIEKYFINLYE